MTDLKRMTQGDQGFKSGNNPANDQSEEANEGAEFGTSERGTRGTNRDADATGESANQGHGHPREDRDQNTD